MPALSFRVVARSLDPRYQRPADVVVFLRVSQPVIATRRVDHMSKFWERVIRETQASADKPASEPDPPPWEETLTVRVDDGFITLAGFTFQVIEQDVRWEGNVQYESEESRGVFDATEALGLDDQLPTLRVDGKDFTVLLIPFDVSKGENDGQG